MLTANSLKPKSFGGDHLLEVLQSDTVISTVNETKFTFEYGGVAFCVSRKDGFFPVYLLTSGNANLAKAAQAPFRNKLNVTFDGAQWVLKAEGIMARQFGLYGTDSRLGTITPGKSLVRSTGIVVDLPNSIPIQVQLYLLLIVARSWESQGS